MEEEVIVDTLEINYHRKKWYVGWACLDEKSEIKAYERKFLTPKELGKFIEQYAKEQEKT